MVNMLYVKMNQTEIQTLNCPSTGTSTIVKLTLKLSQKILMICMFTKLTPHFTTLELHILTIPCKPWPLVAGHFPVGRDTVSVSECILSHSHSLALFGQVSSLAGTGLE